MDMLSMPPATMTPADPAAMASAAIIAAINYAVERGASIINLSASAYANEENAALAEAVAFLMMFRMLLQSFLCTPTPFPRVM